MNKVATELLRDFLKMLGPKIPFVFNDYTVVTETDNEGNMSHIYKFRIPEDIKKQLAISDDTLPMSSKSMDNLLLSKMVNKGVDGKISEMLKFVQDLPNFKKIVDNYFKEQKINAIFMFE